MSGIEGGLLPELDDVSRPFWEGCAAGELRIQRCASCGRRRMPPRPMCPWCRSTESTWEPTSGRGRVWSFVVAHPPLLAAYAEHAPYNVIVVELHEDPTIRFVGNLVAAADGRLDEIDPATITIGETVQVVFAPAVFSMTSDRGSASDESHDAGLPVAFPRWIRV